MIIPATSITDENKKNDLIIYARSINCQAVHNEKYGGIVILTSDRKTTKLIRAKIKELSKS